MAVRIILADLLAEDEATKKILVVIPPENFQKKNMRHCLDAVVFHDSYLTFDWYIKRLRQTYSVPDFVEIDSKEDDDLPGIITFRAQWYEALFLGGTR